MATIFNPSFKRKPSMMKRLYAPPVLENPNTSSARMTQTSCSGTYRDSQGNTIIYTGLLDTDGNCHYYNRRILSAAFDGERMVWSDLTGSGASCADGTPATTTTATPQTTGKGWDALNNALKLAQQYIGARQDTAQSQVTIPAPVQSQGMSTGAVVGIVAGIAVIGGIIYMIAKK